MALAEKSPEAAPPTGTSPETSTSSEPITSEGSLRGSFVALITPVVALGGSWVAAKLAQHTGADLDKNQITVIMVAVVTTVLGAAYKWLEGWQRHEQRVSNHHAMAVKPLSSAPAVPTPPALPAGVSGGNGSSTWVMHRVG